MKIRAQIKLQTIMIYGKTGQLSQCLVVKALRHGFKPIVIGRPTSEVDDFEAISKRIEEYRPDIFINASAYNDVDGAESDYDTAYKVNAIGPMLMARAAKNANIPIIHVSTDYVFSGDKNSLYIEEDEPNPINKYGLSKLAGEKKVAMENDNHVIIRTSWIFSPFGKNFLKTLLESAKTNKKINMFAEQYNIPTSGIDLAKNILEISKRLIRDSDNKELRGVFHVCSQGIASRTDYAKYIFHKSQEHGLPYSEIKQVESTFFNSNTKRPKFSAMDCSKFQRIFGINIRIWQDTMDEVFTLLTNQKIKP